MSTEIQSQSKKRAGSGHHDELHPLRVVAHGLLLCTWCRTCIWLDELVNHSKGHKRQHVRQLSSAEREQILLKASRLNNLATPATWRALRLLDRPISDIPIVTAYQCPLCDHTSLARDTLLQRHMYTNHADSVMVTFLKSSVQRAPGFSARETLLKVFLPSFLGQILFESRCFIRCIRLADIHASVDILTGKAAGVVRAGQLLRQATESYGQPVDAVPTMQEGASHLPTITRPPALILTFRFHDKSRFFATLSSTEKQNRPRQTILPSPPPSPRVGSKWTSQVHVEPPTRKRTQKSSRNRRKMNPAFDALTMRRDQSLRSSQSVLERPLISAINTFAQIPSLLQQESPDHDLRSQDTRVGQLVQMLLRSLLPLQQAPVHPNWSLFTGSMLADSFAVRSAAAPWSPAQVAAHVEELSLKLKTSTLLPPEIFTIYKHWVACIAVYCILASEKLGGAIAISMFYELLNIRRSLSLLTSNLTVLMGAAVEFVSRRSKHLVGAHLDRDYITLQRYKDLAWQICPGSFWDSMTGSQSHLVKALIDRILYDHEAQSTIQPEDAVVDITSSTNTRIENLELTDPDEYMSEAELMEAAASHG